MDLTKSGTKPYPDFQEIALNFDQTERQIGRQREGEIETHTDRQTDTIHALQVGIFLFYPCA